MLHRRNASFLLMPKLEAQNPCHAKAGAFAREGEESSSENFTRGAIGEKTNRQSPAWPAVRSDVPALANPGGSDQYQPEKPLLTKFVRGHRIFR